MELKLDEVRETARRRLRGICRVCRHCDGKNCAGSMPGMGGKGTGASFRNNAAALARIFLNLRALHDAADPDTGYELFGRTLAFPILGAPMCETTYNFRGRVDDRSFIFSQVSGAAAAGTLAMTGDSPQPDLYGLGLEAIQAEGAGIAVIKPRAPEEILKSAWPKRRARWPWALMLTPPLSPLMPGRTARRADPPKS